MRKVLLITLTIAATLLGIFLLWFFGPVMAIFGASVALSAALRPLVARLEVRGVGRGLAILIWYLVILAVLGGGLVFFAGRFSVNVVQAQVIVPAFYQRQIGAWAGGSPLERALAQALPSDFASFWTGLNRLGLEGGSVSGLLNGAVNILVFLLGVFSLAFYWLMEVTRFERLWLSVLPLGARLRARDIWRTTERAVGAYIRSTVSAVLLATVVLYTFYTLLDIPLTANWALLGGLSHLVPRIGPALSVLPAVLMALTYSPTDAVGALIIGVVVQIGVHHFTEYLMRAEAVKVNPLLQVLLLLALTSLGGVSLLIYAPALAALIQTLYPNLLAITTNQPQSTALDILDERLQSIRRSAPPDSLELGNALKRSEDLLTQARTVLDER